MIFRLYNKWQITNSGEKEADKQLSLPGADDEVMYVMHHVRLSSRYHPTQMAGECDFVVLTRRGIMIVEVKGGIIGYGKQPEGGTGYYRMLTDRKKESLDDPFIQVDGNTDAIQKYLLEKNLRNIFVGKLVCFPECGFTRSSIGQDDLWHREHELSLPDMIMASLENQIEKFHENEIRNRSSRYIDWKELDEDEMKHICDALEPEFNPSAYRSLLKLNLDEADRRVSEGLAILSGLNENRRLIIQGPPGCGKSTYALDIIMRLCRNEGLKGLYLCWNELLLAEMKARIASSEADIPHDKIHAKLYFDLACELGELSGDRSLVPTKDTVKRGGVRECVKGAVAKIGSRGKIEKYDFIVVDEAQDIFDKGIDHVLKALLKVNNPLQNGRYYIFYDDSQDYPGSDDMGYYVRTRDMFKANAASYILTSSLRVNTGHGINGLIADASEGKFEVNKRYGEDVVIRTYKTPEEALKLIKQAVNQEKTIAGLCSDSILTLFSFDLLKNTSSFLTMLSEDSSFELLTADNCSASSDKIRFTSILKAKGLERDVVILVCSSAVDHLSVYQIFIGASRAKVKVHLLISHFNSTSENQT